MRVRSTGLGNSVMEARIDTIEKKKGHLILHIRSSKPVKWHIRGAVDYRELLSIILMLIKQGAVQYLLFGWSRKKESLADDF
jgi:hypothetical protein